MLEPIRVFTARRIVTMEPSLPMATAIAVRGERIVEVGSLETLQPWLSRHPHTIDRRFEQQVLLPGMIDPHIHPMMMAVLLACRWITPEAWRLPGEVVPATLGKEAFLARLRMIVGEVPADAPVLTFGYHAQYHGEVDRADLDAISSTRPIVCWQRSFHELRCNSAALAWLDAEEGAAWDPHIELQRGRLYESGMAWGLRTITPHLLAGDGLPAQLARVRALVHAGGVTTVADAGYGVFDFDAELAAFGAAFGANDCPFRLYLMPNVLAAKGRYKAQVMEVLAEHRARDLGKVRFLRAAKFFADGAFIAQLMQLGAPGYIDGHEGAWLSTPEQLLAMARPWWQAGYQLHVHANGDVGVQSCLDALATLLAEHPRFDHRTLLHHVGISTSAQARRMAALGIGAQFNGYFLWLFGEKLVDAWLGHERASQITRAGSVHRWGGSVAAHSDLPMGPVLPLRAAQNLALRETREGQRMAPGECLPLEAALAAVTTEAAWQLGLEQDIGSLAAGKLADFAVLGADPFEVGAANLADIPVLATVSGGVVHPLAAR